MRAPEQGVELILSSVIRGSLAFVSIIILHYLILTPELYFSQQSFISASHLAIESDLIRPQPLVARAASVSVLIVLTRALSTPIWVKTTM
jgi:hypothetical protein